MRVIRRKRYYFSDSSIASDTIIAFVMGGLSLLIEIAGMIVSVVTRGHVPDIFGILYVCALFLSVSGEIFAWLGSKAQEGGVKGKRLSAALNILTFIIPVWMMFLAV